MKTIKTHWARLAGGIAAGLALIAIYACLSAWGQTLPGLGISLTGTNQVSLTVTNGTNNTQYQIYYIDSLDDPNYQWLLWTNGTTGQTNFTANLGDTQRGFFKAVNNPSFIPPVINIVIQSPTNGSTIY